MARRLAERGGAIMVLGCGGAAMVFVGIAAHESGAGRVFPGPLTDRTPVSAAGDAVLAGESEKAPLSSGVIMLATDLTYTPDTVMVGPPTPLLATQIVPSLPARPVAAPVKRAPAVRAVPVTAKPLIPPAPPPAKLGPPPEARAPLPMDTDLQPLGPAPAPPQSGAPAPASGKSSSG